MSISFAVTDFSTVDTSAFTVGGYQSFYPTNSGSNLAYLIGTSNLDGSGSPPFFAINYIDVNNSILTNNLTILNNEGLGVGYIGINNTNPLYELDVNGDVNVNGNLYYNGTLAGLWQNNANGLYLLNTNIGIGTNNPSYALQVVGSTYISGNIYASNLKPSAFSDTTIASNITSGTLSAARLPATTVIPKSYGTPASNVVIYVDSTGRLLSASNVLTTLSLKQVIGLAASASNDTTNASNITSGTLNLQRFPTTNILNYGQFGASNVATQITTDQYGRVTNIVNYPIILTTDSITGLSPVATGGAYSNLYATPFAYSASNTTVYNGIGNLGIGTNSAIAKLHVVGDILGTGNLYASNLTILGTTTTVNVVTKTAETLHIENSYLGPAIYVNQDYPGVTAEFYNKSNITMILDATGNVGIGTKTPAYTLDVHGDVGISGDITAGNLAASAFTDTTNAANITSGTLPVAQLPTSGVTPAAYGGSSSTVALNVDAAGRITSATSYPISISVGQVTGLSASSTVDTTNANNINKGTLPVTVFPSADIINSGQFGQQDSITQVTTDPYGRVLYMQEQPIQIIPSQVIGLAPSATTDTTIATNITSGTLPAAQLPSTTVNVGTYGVAASNVTLTIDRTGRITSAANVYTKINYTQVTGLAPSATTDTTSATNISKGTLPAARLPASGVTASTYGSAANSVQIAVDATGRITGASSPAIQIMPTQVTGLAPSATTDTTNATNITSGTLDVSRFPTTNVVNYGVYGSANKVAQITTDQYGRVVSLNPVNIAIDQTAVSGLAASASNDTTNATNITTGTLSYQRMDTTNIANVGQFGTASSLPVITVDSYGRVTNVTPQIINIDASQVVTGLAPSATTDTTNATNITKGTLPAARLPASGVRSNLYSTVASNVQIYIDATGRVIAASNVAIQIVPSQVTGLAPSATTDTTVADNITSGTLNLDRLPTTNVTSIGPFGGPNSLPVITVDAYGRVTNVTTQPIEIDVSEVITGLSPSATIDTTIASNIKYGILPATVLPTSGVRSNLYGTAASNAVMYVDQTGRVVAASNVAIKIIPSQVTGLAPSATTDTTNATNIRTGVLSYQRMDTTNVASGTYGSASTVGQIVVDNWGRVVNGSANIPIGIAAGQVSGLATVATSGDYGDLINTPFTYSQNSTTTYNGNGNIGIGTNNAVTTLHVVGDTYISGKLYASNLSIIGQLTTVKATQSNISSSVVIQNLTSTPALSVTQVVPGVITEFYKSDLSIVMQLDQTGNVGIGTKNPSKTLSVVGDIGATGTISAANLTVTSNLTVDTISAGNLVPSAFIDTTNALNITSGTLLASLLPTSGVRSNLYGMAASNAQFYVDATGRIVAASNVAIKIDRTQVIGLAASASNDTTIADNITSGVLNLARLPTTNVTSVGSYGNANTLPIITVDQYGRVTSVSTQQIQVDVSEVITGLAPSATINTTIASNVKYGLLPASVLPPTTVSSNLYGMAASNAQFFVDQTGRIVAASNVAIKIDRTQVIGLAASASNDTTNATNITSGTLSLDRLPTTNVIVHGTYGTPNTLPIITTDQYGRVINVTTQQIQVDVSEVITGLSPSATIDTTIASNVKYGLLPASVLPPTTVSSNLYGMAASNVQFFVDQTGRVVAASNIAIKIDRTQVIGLAASASNDTTNATNIITGTLSAARLPIVTSVSSNLYGTVASNAQFFVDQTGRIVAASNVAIKIDRTQVIGLAASASNDTTNATNITSGTLNLARLPTTNVTSIGPFGNSNTLPIITIDQYGRVTSVTTQQIQVDVSEVITGLAPSATIDTTIASNIQYGLLPDSVLPPTTVNSGSYGIASSNASIYVDQNGRLLSASNVAIQIIPSQVTGLAPSATIDTTIATNIKTGTVNLGLLPTSNIVSYGTFGSNSYNTRIITDKYGRVTNVTYLPIAIASNAVSGLSTVAGTGLYSDLISSSTPFTYSPTGTTYYNGTGNVGIGTTNASSALHVVGDILSTGRVTANNITIVGELTTVNVTTSNTQQLEVINSGPGPALMVAQQTNSVVSQFYNYQGPVMTIGGNGNVGIGTTTPTKTLHVQGDANITGTVSLPGTINISGITNITGNAQFNTPGVTDFYGITNLHNNTNISGPLNVTGAATANFNSIAIAGTTTFNGTATMNNATTVNNNLSVSGTTSLSSNLSVTGIATLSSNLSVAGTTILTGAATLNNNLAVSGTTVLTGVTTINSATAVNNNLTVGGTTSLSSNLSVTGIATLSSNLSVAGTTVLTGAATLNNNLVVAGTAIINSATAVNNNLSVSGTTALSSNLAVTGIATLSSNLTVVGTTIHTGAVTINNNLAVSGTVALSSNLAVNGITSLSSNLTVAGTATINSATAVNNNLTVSGTASLSSNLTVTGITTLSSNLSVAGTTILTGAATLNNNLSVAGTTIHTGAVTINNNLAVTGTTALSSNLSVSGIATLSSNLTVAGTTTMNSATTVNNNLTVSGTTALSSNLSVTGIATLSSNLSVAGITVLTGAATLNNNLAVAGAATLNNNLAVAGATTFNGITSMNSVTAINSNLTVSGIATFSSNLSVAGTTVLTGAATLNNNLAVTGATTFTGTTTMNNAATVNNNLTVSGTTALSGNLSVGGTTVLTGAATLNNNLAVAGATTFTGTATMNNATAVNNNLTVTGTTTLSSNLAVTGIATLSSNLSVAGTTVLTGAVTLNNNLAVTGATTFTGTTTMNNAATVNNNLTVTGTTALSSNLSVTGIATLSSNVSVIGNIAINGTTTMNNATFVNNNLTVSGITTLSSNLSVNGNSTLGGTTIMNGVVTVNSNISVIGVATISSNLYVTGNNIVSGTAVIYGPTTVNNNLIVSGTTGLFGVTTINGATTLTDNLTVSGRTNLLNNITITGTTTLSSNLSVSGNTSIIGSTLLSGATTLNSNLTVAGITTLSSNLSVSGNAIVNGTTLLSGSTTINGVVNLNNNVIVTGTTSISSNLTVSGNATVTGITTLSSNVTIIGNTLHSGGITVNGSTALSNTLTVYGNTTLNGNVYLPSNTYINNVILAQSATIDTTNATNITTGTLNINRLATTNAAQGTYGTANSVGQVVVDQFGRVVTGSSNIKIAIDISQISGLPSVATSGGNYSNLNNLPFYYDPINTTYYMGTGNVGIGTQNANMGKLQVQGNAYINGTITASNLNIIGELTTVNVTTSNSTQLDVINSGPGPALKVVQTDGAMVAQFYNNVGPILTLNGNGNIGIGTVTANKTLHVQGDTYISGTISGGGLVASAFNDTTNAANITSGLLPVARLPATGVSANLYGTVASNVAIYVDAAGRVMAASNVAIQIAASQVTGLATVSTSGDYNSLINKTFVLNSNLANVSYYLGNVGIGNSTPTSVLSVGGGLSDTKSSIQINVGDQSGGTITDRLLLTAYGASNSKISHSSNSLYIYAGPSNLGGSFHLLTGSTTDTQYHDRITVGNVNGYVGINNASPNYTLDTAGNINFTGTLYSSGTQIANTGFILASALPTTGVIAATYGTAASNVIKTIDATGRITSATNVAIQIVPSQVTGLASSASNDTTNAANITSGLLPVARLPATGVSANLYGTAASNVAIYVDSAGRVMAASNVAIQIPYTQVTGLAKSAYTDATNAANLSGTLSPSVTFQPSGVNAGTYGIANSNVTLSINSAGFVTSANYSPIILPYNQVTGIAPSATIDTTIASNVKYGILPASVLPTTGVASNLYGTVASNAVIYVDQTGRVMAASNVAIQIASYQVTGLAASATTDTTNATNISFGTLSYLRMDKTNVVAQGTYGNANSVAQIVTDGYGRVANGTTNVPIQLAFNQVTGLAASASNDTTNATNITTGTLNALRLPTSGVSAGSYGAANSNMSVSVDTYGRVTSVTNTAVIIPTSQITGLAASATTDTTNATNIGSGTLNALRLPTTNAAQGTYGTANAVGQVVVDQYGRIVNGSSNIPISIASNAVSGLSKVAGTGVYNDLISTPFTYSTSGTTYYNGTGNVGIGTQTAMTALHVIGDILTSGKIIASNLSILGELTTVNLTTSNSTQLDVINSGPGPALKVAQTSVDIVSEFYNASGIVMQMNTNGNVGIGTKNASKTLFVQGDIGLSSGLHVNGSANISGSIFASNLAPSATTDTTNATNIGSGTLNSLRLPTSGVNAGSYGAANSNISVNVDTYGRVTSVTNTAVIIPTSQITGLAPSATTDTTNATNIGSGTLNALRLPTSGVSAGSYGTANSNISINVDTYGRVTSVTNTAVIIPTSQITGLAPSATTDTTNATNITTGTLSSARLPTSGITAGGYGGSGSVASNLSFYVDTYGRVTSVSSNLIKIAVTQVSGLAASASNDTTNATNITTGTLSSNLFPVSGVTSNMYGNASSVSQFVVDGTGRLTYASTVPINISASTQVSGLYATALSANAPSSIPTAGTYGNASLGTIPVITTDLYGRIISAQSQNLTLSTSYITGSLPITQISGLAASASNDTTNATNITTGTLSSGRLPTVYVSAMVYGGIQNSNINLIVDTYGRVTSSTNTPIVLPTSQITGLAPSATTDTTIATNIKTGTLTSNVLPPTVVNNTGVYGGGVNNLIPQITVDQYGRVSNITTVTPQITTANLIAIGGLTAGTYGSSISIPSITVDNYGRVTAANGNPITLSGVAATGQYSNLANIPFVFSTTNSNIYTPSYVSNVGIGMSNATAYPLDVNGIVRATRFIGDGSLLTGVVTGSGSAGLSSQWTTCNMTVAIYGGSNVGIGTTYVAPNYKLQVQGDSAFTGSIVSSNIITSNLTIYNSTFIAGDTQVYRAALQVNPLQQFFTVATTTQSVFTLTSTTVGRYTAYGSNVAVYQNGIKLGYQNATNNDYTVTVINNSTSTTFSITLANPANIGDYLDITVFPQLVSTNLTLQPGYVYQQFYDLWSASNNNVYYTAGNVGVGTIAPAYPLHVAGTIYTTNSVVSYSDIAIKTNVETITDALDTVNKLRGVTYNRRDNGLKQMGVIAQEVLEVIPEVVTRSEDGLAVAYGNLVGVLIEAVKELSTEVSDLRKIITDAGLA